TLSLPEEVSALDHINNSPDDDGDGVPNIADNCVMVPNVNQADANGNGIGDACEITPSVCIVHPGDRDGLRAVFGYTNNNSQVAVPVGPDNTVSPALTIDSGAQTTVFATGTHNDVFQIPFDHKHTVTWTVNGISATASLHAPNCGSGGAPVCHGN